MGRGMHGGKAPAQTPRGGVGNQPQPITKGFQGGGSGGSRPPVVSKEPPKK